MRLSHEERAALKGELAKISPEAKIYLFGSRVDDGKRGGDIDLLIVSGDLTKRDLRRLRLAFFERFGEQKIDILLEDGSFTDPFVQMVRSQAVPL